MQAVANEAKQIAKDKKKVKNRPEISRKDVLEAYVDNVD